MIKNKFFSLSKTVDIAITNYCNARCPQCHSTNPNGLGAMDWLPMTSWSLEDFTKMFPKESLDDIEEYSFCGTWGDPMMAKDIEKICHYIMDNSKAKILITTNGSIRDEDFYWRLGVRCGTRLSIVFDIDGTTEEMHQKYRRGASLEKVLKNMNTLSQTPATALSQSIIFKHNQDYKKDISKLAKDNGSENHEFCNSNRFYFGGTKFGFINEQGVYEELVKANEQDSM